MALVYGSICKKYRFNERFIGQVLNPSISVNIVWLFDVSWAHVNSYIGTTSSPRNGLLDPFHINNIMETADYKAGLLNDESCLPSGY